MNQGVLDYGCEIDAFIGPYRYYYTNSNHLDYYFMNGGAKSNCVSKVMNLYQSIVGRSALPPRYSFGYLASAMGYAESENAQELITEFPSKCKQFDIKCDLIHLSSGYTVDMVNGARNVFTINTKRFPDLKKMVSSLLDSGIRISANIKPWLLDCHPDKVRISSEEGLIKNSETGKPSQTRLWSSGEGQTMLGSYIDFSSKSGSEYWIENVSKLVELGIKSIWV